QLPERRRRCAEGVDRRARVVEEAADGELGGAGAAPRGVGGLEDGDVHACSGEEDGPGQAVRARAHDEGPAPTGRAGAEVADRRAAHGAILPQDRSGPPPPVRFVAVELAAFQQVIADTYAERDRARGVPATVAWIAEEVGELAQAVRKGTRDQQLHELGDVLAWLASLAEQL